MAPSEWGPRRLADFTGVERAAKAVPDTPLVAVRATTVRLSLRYSTYIPLKTLVHPGCLSIPTHSTPFALGKTAGLCTGSARRARTHSALPCTAHLSISFYYCTESTAAINPRTPQCFQIGDAVGVRVAPTLSST